MIFAGLFLAACSDGDAKKKAQIAAQKKAEAERLAALNARKNSGPAPGTPGYIFSDCPQCPQMVVIPAGENDIGVPDDDASADANERPLAWVKFSKPFAVSRYEVRVREFTAFADATGFEPSAPCNTDGVGGAKASFRNPGLTQTEGDPVICVNVADANRYAAWLSKKTGHTYHLLSEGQWEYVRRSKTKASRETAVFDDETPAETGNVKSDNWLAKTLPGGSYNSNSFLVFDMLGNVEEWTSDCWQVDHRNQPKDGGPATTTGDCTAHAVRGGSWDARPERARPTARRRVPADTRDWRIGFRLMRDAPPIEKDAAAEQ